jgi:hypothetical protein
MKVALFPSPKLYSSLLCDEEYHCLEGHYEVKEEGSEALKIQRY